MQGLAQTAQELADSVWNAQEGYEPGLLEAEQQQRRALVQHVTDVLVILSGLGYVTMSPRPNRHALPPKGRPIMLCSWLLSGT